VKYFAGFVFDCFCWLHSPEGLWSHSAKAFRLHSLRYTSNYGASKKNCSEQACLFRRVKS